MGKYDETRARQILESAADVLAPDLGARRDAARELIRELGALAGATRVKTVTAGDNKARLAIGEHAVTIFFDGLQWEVHPDGGSPVMVDLGFNPHDRKFVGDGNHEGMDGLSVVLDVAMGCMKTRRDSEAVQQALGSVGHLIRH